VEHQARKAGRRDRETGITIFRFFCKTALSARTQWIKNRFQGGQVIDVYFNNDAEGHAVRNATPL